MSPIRVILAFWAKIYVANLFFRLHFEHIYYRAPFKGPPGGGPARGRSLEAPDDEASAPGGAEANKEPAATPPEPPDDKNTHARRIARVDDDTTARTCRTVGDLLGALERLLSLPYSALKGIDQTIVDSLLSTSTATSKLLAELQGAPRPKLSARDELRQALNGLRMRAGHPGPRKIAELTRNSSVGPVAADTINTLMQLPTAGPMPSQRTVARVVSVLGGDVEAFMAMWYRLRAEHWAELTRLREPR